MGKLQLDHEIYPFHGPKFYIVPKMVLFAMDFQQKPTRQLSWDNMNAFPVNRLNQVLHLPRQRIIFHAIAYRKTHFSSFFQYTIGRSATMKIKWWFRPHPTNIQQLTNNWPCPSDSFFSHRDLKLQSMVTRSCPYIPWSLRTIIVQRSWISPDNLHNRGCWA